MNKLKELELMLEEMERELGSTSGIWAPILIVGAVTLFVVEFLL